MLKKLLVGVLVLAFVATSAQAVIGQIEGFELGAGNIVLKTGGMGSAQGGNMGMMAQNQKGADLGSGSIAMQDQTGIVTQSAEAVGAGGTTAGAGQIAGVGAEQGQAVAPNLTTQGQGVDLGLGQLVGKTSGIGAAVGAQGAVVGQNQIAASPTGFTASGQMAGGAQFGAVAGGDCNTGMVGQCLEVTGCQVTINAADCPKNPCTPPCPPPTPQPPCGGCN